MGEPAILARILLKFRWRHLSLTLRLLLMTGLALLVAGGALLYTSLRQSTQQVGEELAEQADNELVFVLAALTEPAVIGDYSVARQILAARVRREAIDAMTWVDERGNAVEVLEKSASQPVPAIFHDWLGLPEVRREGELEIGGRNYGRVSVVMNMQAAEGRLWEHFVAQLEILLFAVCLEFLCIVLVVARSLQPLGRLNEAARHFGEGDWTIRAGLEGSPEIRSLIATFNRMAGGIQGLVADLDSKQAALAESESRFRSMIEEHAAVMLLLDPQDGRILSANLAARGFYGYPRKELLERSIQDISLQAAPMVLTEIAAAVSGERNILLFEHRLANGEARSVEMHASPIVHEGKTLLFAIIHDISERKRMEEGLRLAASVFGHAREGITITDTGGRILDVNPAFTEITGYRREEVVGQSPSLLKSGHQGPEFYAQMWQALAEHGHWQGEIWNRRKSGEVYAELLSISSVLDEAGGVSRYIGTFVDISQLKEQQRQLEQIAHYDALTGLPNRVLLADRMNVAISRGRRQDQRLAVAYLDLDGFKAVNDTHGHHAGDRLLVEIARRLQQAIRGGDSVARLGGDEFVLLMADIGSVEDCERALVRLLRALGEPVMLGELPMQVSASIGVTIYPDDDGDPDTLLRHADQAMYVAKEAGKNRYHLFDPEHDRLARSHRGLLNRVEAALQNGEFRLHYQPKVRLASGEIVGFEALIRWQDPARGLVAPADFIPLVEASELAIPLGEWVLAEAIGELQRWRAAGHDWSVSINVSPRHLESPGFLGYLEGLLGKSQQVPRHAVELEVLESVALSDIEAVSKVMAECRALGASFAIDDFGTGYSSLTYFKRLPADVLKIDQSFIRDMLVDPEYLAIIEGIIGLTRAFRRMPVAEGVEEMAQGVMLIHLGCELAQGYAIARPMPADAVSAWAQSWRPDPVWLAAGRLRWPHDDLPLLFAELDHRHWVEQLLQCVRKPEMRLDCPPLATDQCRFGGWLNSQGMVRYATFPSFSGLVPVHDEVHHLGHRIADLLEAGRGDEAAGLLQELEGLRERLLLCLRSLQDEVAAERLRATTPV